MKKQFTVRPNKAYTIQDCMFYLRRQELVGDRNGISVTTDQEQDEADKLNGVINFGSVMQEKRMSVKVFIQFDADDDNQKMKFTNCELVDNARNVFTIGDKHNIHQGKKVILRLR